MATWGYYQAQVRSISQDRDGDYWPDDELIQSAIQRQKQIAREARWKRASATVTAVAGFAVYDMPTDLFELHAPPTWDGWPLAKTDAIAAPRRLGSTWKTSQSTPRHYLRDVDGERSIRLALVPSGASTTVDSGDINNTTDPLTLGVDDADGIEADDVLAVWDDTTYDHPHDDPNLEYVTVTAVSGNDLTVTRGSNGTTAVAHAGTPAIATAWVDYLGLDYIALPTDPVDAASTIYLPQGGERCFIYGILADCFLKDVEPSYQQQFSKFDTLFRRELETLKRHSAEEFDTLPGTVDIPIGFL